MSPPSQEQIIAQQQQRIQELEAQLQSYQQVTSDSDQPPHLDYARTKTWIEQWLEVAPDPTIIIDPRGSILQINSQALQLFGYERSEILGQQIEILVPADIRKMHVNLRDNFVHQPRTRAMAQGLDLVACHKSGQHIPVEISLSPIHTELGHVVISSIRDITDRKNAEAEYHRLQEEIIHIQQIRLDELSTPLLPINEHIIAMPLIGTIDEHRAEMIIETLLTGITQYQSEIALIDITGVPMLDESVANSLLRCTQAAQLLGAKIVLTGIRPEAAQTLVALGIDMHRISTHANLQSGIAYALQLSSSV
jgi:rsbT co-antagonist protein RsbR